jgi:hypothetical protein
MWPRLGLELAFSGSMGHQLRQFFSDTVYELTTRTMQGRLLMRPSEKLRKRLVGVIARAQELYDVCVYAFIILSNHWHLLASAKSAQKFALFLAYVNGNIAKECSRENDWSGPFWGRRVSAIPCVDEAATLDRFNYVLRHGVKEGLVASPTEWPGASAVPGLLGDMSVAGEWVDRDAYRRAKRAAERRGNTMAEEKFTYPNAVTLTPLPAFRTLSPDALRNKHRELVQEVCSVEKDNREGTPILGVAALLAQEPHQKANQLARSPVPRCHASTLDAYVRYRRAYRSFVDAYRSAVARISKLVTPLGVLIAKAGQHHAKNKATKQDRNIETWNEMILSIPEGAYVQARWTIASSAQALADIVGAPAP